MPDSNPIASSTPAFVVDGDRVRVHGRWVFDELRSQRAHLQTHFPTGKRQWDLQDIAQIDSSGALFLWQGWQRCIPETLRCNEQQRTLFEALQRSDEQALTTTAPSPQPVLQGMLGALGEQVLSIGQQPLGLLRVFGQVVLASVWLLRHPAEFPGKALSAAVFRSGVQALGITALVGFLIGVVLSYLSAQQLAQYGANVLIVDLLGIAIVRELAPLLAAILVAGRSGSAITAQIGIMKINQELDAMHVLGLSSTLRLAWPRVMALMLVMPLLALWTDMLALFGGMLAARMELGLSMTHFLERLPEVVDVRHLWVGLGKSVVFGGLIGLIACHFGFRVRSSSESLGKATTASVVSGISLVILADAVFAVLLSIGSTS